MKKLIFTVCCFLFLSCVWSQSKPKVFILTDINLVGGDPDDRQSLLHLFWYSDELEIVGIVPDYWEGKGVEACRITLEAYQSDFKKYDFAAKGLATPSALKNIIIKSASEAVEKLKRLTDEHHDPIYVLVWGGMTTLQKVLFAHPEIADKIRVLTIATGVKYGPKDEVAGEKCDIVNWNGSGRNKIYNDPRFERMWWLESNWTYNGMFGGNEPKEMFYKLSEYGAMGAQIKEVTNGHKWAQYFRVGDTPTVTYLLDNNHNIDNPETSSWAGLFKKPFPLERPNYFTDDNGNIEWDYSNPCKTWFNRKKMYNYNKSTLVKERTNMYTELLLKLDKLYDM